MYVTDDVVTFVSVPQLVYARPLPLQLAPLTLQVTPFVVGSPATAAVKPADVSGCTTEVAGPVICTATGKMVYVTVEESDGSAIEVAVTVKVALDPASVLGLTYVTEAAATSVSVPHPLPEQPVPGVSVQVTLDGVASANIWSDPPTPTCVGPGTIVTNAFAGAEPLPQPTAEISPKEIAKAPSAAAPREYILRII